MNPERITDTHIFFWNSVFSQWYTSENQFEENGIIYHNAETYMMIQKAKLFNDQETLEKMYKALNPRMVKFLGRQVRSFDEYMWNKHKLNIVTRANFLKFTQNQEFLGILKKYKNHIIVEASPEDAIWGIGLHFSDDRVLDEKYWRGQNLLGKCIMDVRENILS